MTTVALLTLLAACSSPAKKFDDAAASLGLERRMVAGTTFVHALFWRSGGANCTLHVYLDGDGTPEHAGRPAEDPTPRNPMMLRLLALDAGPAVYIGRPCYHGLAKAPGCSGELWTTGRYSDRVVGSMAAAVGKVMAAEGYERVSFFGYSGGGTLAMLLAQKFSETTAVVTIGANLDIDAWSDHHGTPRLAGSLNPLAQPPLPEHVMQQHYAGRRDRIVPVAITAGAVQPTKATLIVVEGYDHVCCWATLWPDILVELGAAGI